jgi:hypothetical protein
MRNKDADFSGMSMAEVADVKAEVDEPILYLAKNAVKQVRDGNAGHGQVLYAQLQNMDLTRGEIEQMLDVRNMVAGLKMTMKTVPEYIAEVRQVIQAVDPSLDPSGFQRMALEADTIRALPLGGEGDENLLSDVAREAMKTGGGATGAIIAEMVRWGEQGVFLPPDAPPECDAGAMYNLGREVRAAALRIRWWQTGDVTRAAAALTETPSSLK